VRALALQQRGALALIKSRPLENVDPWLKQVAESNQLRMLREIALWWRKFQLGIQCMYTARLMRRLGEFESSVEEYFTSAATSPFIEELSRVWLRSLERHPDSAVRCVAAFERCVIERRAGFSAATEILWDRDPRLVFDALDNGSPLPEAGEKIFTTRFDAIAQNNP
jgi:hypothetical protein